MKENLLFKIKKRIIKLILLLPFLCNVIFYRNNHSILNNKKATIGKLLKLGHAIDLRMHANENTKTEIKEFDYILRRFIKQRVTVDAALLWAINLSTLAKYGLKIKEDSYDIPTSDRMKVTSEFNISLMDAIVNRRSHRLYLPISVGKKDLYDIIDIAKWAPTSCNRQLWKIKIINNENDINFVSNYFSSPFCKNAPIAMLVLMDTKLYGDNEKHFAYLDGGAFIQNLLLLLHSRGYGACWLGFKGWDARDNMFVKRKLYDDFYDYFHLDKSEVPISMITIGRPRINPKPPLRQDLANIVS